MECFYEKQLYFINYFACCILIPIGKTVNMHDCFPLFTSFYIELFFLLSSRENNEILACIFVDWLGLFKYNT